MMNFFHFNSRYVLDKRDAGIARECRFVLRIFLEYCKPKKVYSRQLCYCVELEVWGL